MIVKWEDRQRMDGFKFLDAHYIHEEIEEHLRLQNLDTPNLPSYYMEPTVVLGMLEKLRSRAAFYA